MSSYSGVYLQMALVGLFLLRDSMWGVGKGGDQDGFQVFWLKPLWVVLPLAEMGKLRVGPGFALFCVGWVKFAVRPRAGAGSAMDA